ncbi:hypothetical protein EYZ11_013350 [Aspergillus tanneri]|uniref:Nudix hydrolase domain-containing protein n=1 Tax=Aspergillus tanneri TaxID=1220188 RepID=A0A4S3IXW0_9EURO|nr:uncharacterized protein ATNIH1004_004002 [Aspergillus tanneri]KAA8648119.1 hypothetical protein ATNIH1004_004002 [Aspergillus tanneri]THC87206.1 hypothetical protein EYZ11_013350 [Aspergillus tanneri]
MNTLELAVRPGDDIPISSIELWCIHGDCDYHWLITYTHPSGNTTSVSREKNVSIKWIKDIPREKAIATISFPVTYWCPDLRTLASHTWNSFEQRDYKCTDFVYFLLWEYKRREFIQDAEDQMQSLLRRMAAVQEELSAFYVPGHLEQFQAPLSKVQSDLKVGVLIFSPLKDRVLLVKRSERDSHGNIWECPGGGIEQNDKSIVQGAVRECREETQLHISAFIDVVHENWLKGDRQVRKFIFIADVHESKEPEQMLTKVVLNPAEHQQFQWAKRTEIENMDEAMFFPKQKGIILDAFAFLGTPGW